MSSTRSKVSEADRRFVIGRSAGCCNKCRIPVFRENEFGEQARIGDDAHIWAYSKAGPRGTAPGAPADPNDRENILLLCKNCHAEVDQQPVKFPPEVLTEIREAHDRWVGECLGQAVVEKPRFHYTLYLNLPRLDMYAVANSISLPHFDLGTARSIGDLGGTAGRLMAAYTRILNSEAMYAYQVGEQSDVSGMDVGQHCYVESMNFCTVGIGRQEDLETAWRHGRSILYRRFGDWKLICQIDPRWITTSTAGSTLGSGQARLCGVMRVNRTDAGAREIHASPLFLAQH